jgi:hexosaminidase
VQANYWAEWIPDVPQLFYMALPRELALSEDAWTPPTDKNWASFQDRIGPQFAWFEQQQYNFRIPNPSFAVDAGPLAFAAVQHGDQSIAAETTSGAATVSLSDLDPGATLVYTTDGSDPDRHATRYNGPLHLTLAPGQRIEITAAAMLPNGRTSTTSRLLLFRRY